MKTLEELEVSLVILNMISQNVKLLKINNYVTF